MYNRIAKQWHANTGKEGGALKKYILNDLILEKIVQIENASILELGAGNGYFISLMMKYFSGQKPKKIVITDQSEKLLKIAQKNFPNAIAQYLPLDIRGQFPFDSNEYDIILATMIFNEVSKGGLFRALKECNRVLSDKGKMIATVLHPDFITNLDRRGLLHRNKNGLLTMPGAKNLRLPVVKREMKEYYYLFSQTKFHFEVDDIHPTKEVLNEKSGLKNYGKNPIAAIFTCSKK